MFPPSTEEEASKIGLQNTMRVLPHDQNSGGFYVALLKKHADFAWKQNKKEGNNEEDEKE